MAGSVKQFYMGERGSKSLSDRDWLLGARPRRLLLHALLVRPTPQQGWPLETLTRLCEVGDRGLDRHLARLEGLEIVSRNGRNWRPVAPTSPLMEALVALVVALEDVSDQRRG